MVPVLQLPDPLAWVAGVMLGRDRPERVRRLDDVPDRLSGAAPPGGGPARGRGARPRARAAIRTTNAIRANICSYASEHVFALSSSDASGLLGSDPEGV